MKKEHIVLSQRVAGYLMMNGFVLKSLSPSKKEGSRRNVFIFNESDDLIQAIHNYSKQK